MNTSVVKLFSKVILSDHTVRIKLLGDSITHGVGGRGFDQNGVPFITGFARNPDGYCWANLLKHYLESHFDCEVVNNACTGTKIEFILANFDTLVEAEDDLIICTIGTNNRHQSFKDGPKRTKREHMEMFYEKIVELSNRFKAAGKDVIFMANIPASAENEQDGPDYWRLFHMNDVQDLYVKASLACDFPLIELYSLFLSYCEQNCLRVDDLLSDGLHPNDRGYKVMYHLILRELGIAEAVER